MTDTTHDHMASGQLPIVVSHPDKVFWPAEGYTKMDLVRFYDYVFPKLAPYVKDRLLSLERCPDGMGGECFYQKEKPPGYALGNTDKAAPPRERWLHELRRWRPPRHTTRPRQSGLYRCSRGRRTEPATRGNLTGSVSIWIRNRGGLPTQRAPVCASRMHWTLSILSPFPRLQAAGVSMSSFRYGWDRMSKRSSPLRSRLSTAWRRFTLRS